MRIDKIDQFQDLLRQREALLSMKLKLAETQWPICNHAAVTKKISPALKEFVTHELELIEKQIEQL